MTELDDSIREFLNGRHYAVLGTLNKDNTIHLTPVWYLFENDLFYVSTSSSGRKTRNTMAHPETTIVVDSRRQQGEERWVSASGKAEIIRGSTAAIIYEKILNRYITKQALEDKTVGAMFKAAGDAVIRIKPESWSSWELKSMDDQYFGSVLRQSPEKWFLRVD